LSNQNPFIQAKAAITPFIKAKAAQAKETLFQTKNQWTNKELIDKCLETYAKDCNTQHLAWMLQIKWWKWIYSNKSKCIVNKKPSNGRQQTRARSGNN
jgi:hypothetical protein